MLVLVGWRVLNLDLLLQVVHCITQLQIVGSVQSQRD